MTERLAAASSNAPGAGPGGPAFRWERETGAGLGHEDWYRLAPFIAAGILGVAAVSLVLLVAAPGAAMPIVIVLAIGVALTLAVIWASVGYRMLRYSRPNPTVFEIGPDGVRLTRSRQAAAAGSTGGGILDLAMDLAVSAPAAPPKPAGPEVEFLPWRRVSGHSIDERRLTISLRPTTGRAVILSCGPAEWEAVLAWVRWGTSAATKP